MTRRDYYLESRKKNATRQADSGRKRFSFFLFALLTLMAAGSQSAFAQYFTGGTPQMTSVCENASDSINTLLAVTDTVNGDALTWSMAYGPANGTLTITYSTTSDSGVNTPTGLSYVPTMGYTGPDSFMVYISNGATITDSTTIYVTVNPLPAVDTIAGGAASVCVGSMVTFTDDSTGGVWSTTNANASISAGAVTGVTAGIDTIVYTITNGCGTADTSVAITVNPLADAGVITGGATIVCIGSSITLADISAGGVWSETTGNASVAGGTVTGVNKGTDTIEYIVTNGCNADTATYVVSVDTNLIASPISGAANVCVGGTTTFAADSTGGVWSATNANATILAGLVTGVTAGTDTIVYTITNSCGPAADSQTIMVNAVADAGTIAGPTAVCIGGSTISLSDAAAGGVWSETTGNASVSGGTVTAIAKGTDTIKYIVTTGCNADTASYVISVDTSLIASPISGAASVCVGSSTTFAADSTGGVWSATNANATVVAGLVTGVTAGTDTIVYTISNTCGSVADSQSITVYPVAVAGTITGPTALCLGGSGITLADVATGGVWSATNANATVDVTGDVTAVTAGTDTIKYIVTTGCNADTASYTITVDTNLTGSPISGGAASVCVASSVTFTDAIAGGVWSTTNANATVSIAGDVTGAIGGTDTILYTITNSCGSVADSQSITVYPVAVAGTITGPTALCLGGSGITLADVAAGGVWSETTGNASVSGGTVTAIAKGTDTIKYIVTTGCNADTASYTITVDTNLTGSPISGGAASVCVASSVTFTDAIAGGVWSITNANATVSIAGDVTGAIGGTDTILYTITNSCGSVADSQSITVYPVAVAGTITGPTALCIGGSGITLADAAAGGVWSATNANATVDVTGDVTAVTAGMDTIKYIVTTGCNADTASYTITVDTNLTGSPISGGAASVCVASSVTFTDAIAGGVWSTTNANATVSIAGDVTGAIGGTDTILYTITNSCGSVADSQSITVYPVAVAGTITGPTALCLGGSGITLADVAVGGVWSATNANATVDVTGDVTAVTAGTDTIKYIVTTGCNADTASYTITVDTNLTGSPISGGAASVCVASSVTFTDAIAGGTWTATNADATVAAGSVTGVTAGTDTILYTITNSCGSVTDSQVITVNAVAVAGTITGPTALCIGGSGITLADAATGGVWSATNANVTVDVTGDVTAVTAGMDTIKYIVTTGCNADTASYVISVDSTLTAGTITGDTSVCAGATTTFTADAAGGVWSATNTSATVSIAGVVTGGSFERTDTIIYTVTNSCGSVADSQAITVYPVADAGTITGSSFLCPSSFSSLTLSSSATAGGTWTATNTYVSVSTSGEVIGSSPGTDTIAYTVTTGCGSTSTSSHIITVYSSTPDAGTIGGDTSVCISSTVTFTATVTGGTWSTSTGNATVATDGTVTGVSAGIDTVFYAVTGFCSAVADTTFQPITVGSGGVASVITGTTTLVCTGTTIALSDSVAGGVWSVSNSHATVSTGGVVSGITSGKDTVTYTLSGTCGTSSKTYTVTVNTTPSTATLSGASEFCAATSATFTVSPAGGTFSATNTDVAITGSSVTGVAGGTDTLIYTVSNSCGTKADSEIVTIIALANAGTITGGSSVCTGDSITLADVATGGIWTSNTSRATVTTGGVVKGVSIGIDTIKYTVIGTCGSVTAVKAVTVGTAPTGVTITSSTSGVCIGTTATFAVTPSGGTWSATNGNATVTAGSVAGVTAGTDTIIYTLSNSCGTAADSQVVTIGVSVGVGTITGTYTVCAGSEVTLTDTATAGVWSAVNSNATVTGGVVTGITAGTDTIKYTVAGSCNTAVAKQLVTVKPLPLNPTISGAAAICSGTTYTFTATSSSATGVWSMTNGDATVTTAGKVNGTTGGIDTIIYTNTNSCGSAADSQAVVISTSLPDAGVIVGDTNICVAANLTLTDAGIGTWSVSNSNATISSTGTVTGVTVGTDTVIYTSVNGCGTAVVTQLININALPDAGTITAGSLNLCPAATLVLGESLPGGTWSTSNGDASVNSAGVVTGVSNGLVDIIYSVTNGCGTAHDTVQLTIEVGPNAGAINGTNHVCIGEDLFLTETVTGGVWDSTNGNLIVAFGEIDGVTPGLDTVLYIVHNGCGYDTATHVVKVYTPYECDSADAVNPVTAVSGEFKVYPNPSTGVFNIDIPQTGSNTTVMIMDITGKVMLTRNIIGNVTEASIDISNLPSGNYILKANSGNATYRGKITLLNN